MKKWVGDHPFLIGGCSHHLALEEASFTVQFYGGSPSEPRFF